MPVTLDDDDCRAGAEASSPIARTAIFIPPQSFVVFAAR